MSKDESGPRVAAVGVAWYRREDYDRLKAMFSDGIKLADTFDEWLATAQSLCDKLISEGHVVEKAYIDPEAFPQWCRANGKVLDSTGRMAYANECAAGRFRDGPST